ncbi:MAG: AI-2E family transporter [Nevskia sp.]|nr:AI-2E family transporter [Nevskia sp.]
MQTENSAIQVTRLDLVQWAAAAAALALILQLRLLSALLAGLLVYELVHLLAGLLKLSSIGRRNAKPVAVALLTTLVVVLLTMAIVGIGSVLRHGSDSLPALLQKLAEIIDNSRQRLPQSIVDYLPADADDLRQRLAAWLRGHSGALGGASLLAGRAFAHVLIGMVIGSLLALGESTAQAPRGILGRAVADRAARLSESFRRVVFAQTWIAAINAGFTGIYLLAVLPACGVHLPLTKTMVALTFIAGLIPIVGNLVSNSVIVVVSLSSSFGAAVASLGFLVAVHKFEYFLNARIIGAHVRARAWELLVAMVLMEAAFGLSGVVAAPIFYAYFKDELSAKGLV